MKNKRLLAIIAAMAVSAGSAAVSFADPITLTVDGTAVDGEVILIDNVTMLPLRAMAETIGYTVNWEAESGTVVLSGIADDITVKPVAADASVQARSIEKSPEIHNDRTYVPVNFVNDVLGLACDIDSNGNVAVYTEIKEEEPELKRKVTINSIEEEQISVNDEIIGEVILMIADETKISKDGEEISLSDITKEDVLMVEYSPAMTMSLPPQCTAVSIEVLTEEAADSEGEAAENVAFEGEISEITEDGMVIVISEENKIGVALKISVKTQIAHSVNKRIYKAEDLEVGMKVSGEHSSMMTRSLPPQTEAFSIIIK